MRRQAQAGDDSWSGSQTGRPGPRAEEAGRQLVDPEPEVLPAGRLATVGGSRLAEEGEEAPLRLAHQPEPPGPALLQQQPHQDLRQLVAQLLDLPGAREPLPVPELVQPVLAPVPLVSPGHLRVELQERAA